jgi:DNA-binding transcriptional ArsR family regulator
MSKAAHTPILTWDWGTAYDLFASLFVLLQPDRFGLRGSWAAGVRSRLPVMERKFLEEIQEICHVPLRWIYLLDAPKDAASALWKLGQTPVGERISQATSSLEKPVEVEHVLREVAARRSWDERDLDALRTAYQCKDHPPRPKALLAALDWWSRADEFGERYLAAFQAYHAVFFAEEERHIRVYLEESVAHAQALAQEMPAPALLETLSQGVRLPFLDAVPELVLIPSYWITPLVAYGQVSEGHWLFLYGARPDDVSLVSGEQVPDAMLRALKALADPTRLRVLRYLADAPQTPSSLSRLLRLRAPTVIHHLSALRAAGLVQLTLKEGDEKRYAIRAETIGATFEALRRFLEDREEAG